LNLFDNQLKLHLLQHINNKSSSFEDVKALAVMYEKRKAKIMQMDTGSSSSSSPSQHTVPPQKKSTSTKLICDWCNKHGHVEKFCYSKDRYFKLKKIKICSLSTCDYKPGSTVQGIIKWFNPSSGYGFICLRNSDKDVFFHRSDLRKFNRNNFAKFATGQVVTFYLCKTAQGLRATHVCVQNNIPRSSDKLSMNHIISETNVQTLSRSGHRDCGRFRTMID
jgi:cold shock CspA family protein